MPPPDAEQSRWFALEVQPHEPALRSYLQSRFPSLRDLDDVVQEAYTRVLRENAAGRLRHVRAFLFTAARNVALDLFRRRERREPAPITHFDPNSVVQEGPDAAEALDQQEKLELLAEAVRTLPDRCRQVIVLRYVKGCSYHEIAAELGISSETVKTHMAKGMKRCAEYFDSRGLLGEKKSSSSPTP